MVPAWSGPPESSRAHPEVKARTRLAVRGSQLLVSVLVDSNARRYYLSMIRGFRDRDTESVFRRERSRRLPSTVQRIAQRKLAILHAADSVQDLRVPPGNRLERLSGDREGQHSIRINDRWRICFYWRNGDAHDVEIVDYH